MTAPCKPAMMGVAQIGQERKESAMKCDNYEAQTHEAQATHRIGVDSGKARVCEACYNAIIEDAIAGKVRIWDCN